MLLPLLVGLATTAQPIYAALTVAPTALLAQGDALWVAAPGEVVRFRLDRGELVERRRIEIGPVRHMTGGDPVILETADGSWRWSPGSAPERLLVSASGATRQVVIGAITWTLDAKGAVLRDGAPIAAVGATDLVGMVHHGVLAYRRGAAATGEGDLVRFDPEGRQVWRSGVAPVPTAAAFDSKRSAIWVGRPDGGVDRWRITDGDRVPAIPSGRSEPIRCVATASAAGADRVIVGDRFGGLWVWRDRQLVHGERLDGEILTVALDPAPTAVVRQGDRLIRWRLSDAGEATVAPEAKAPAACAPPRFPEADDSLLHGGVRYVVRADGHWRAESKAGVTRGRTTPRRGR